MCKVWGYRLGFGSKTVENAVRDRWYLLASSETWLIDTRLAIYYEILTMLVCDLEFLGSTISFSEKKAAF